MKKEFVSSLLSHLNSLFLAASGQKIGPRGFEPLTSCTPSKRASQAALRPDFWPRKTARCRASLFLAEISL
jgi:hypothetical protein